MIRSVSFTIDGTTRKSVLANYLDIREGETLRGKMAFEDFLEDKRRLLGSQRTLASGDIFPEYTPDLENEDRVFVDIEVRTVDTWNYIALPYPKYDSNEGLLLSFRGRNYNFLGGMETLEVNLDYVKVFMEDEDFDSKYSVNGGFDIPLYFAGYEWMFKVDEDISLIDYGDERLLQNTSRLGLSVGIPMTDFTWQIAGDHYFYLNEKEREDPDGFYMKSTANPGISFPLNGTFPMLLDPNYNVAALVNYAYKPFGQLSEKRRGFELGAKHGFSFGRVDWLGNFRDGLSLKFDQNLRYNFDRELWLSNLDLELESHHAFDWGGFSGRMVGFYRFNDVKEDAGEPIRGIMDSRVEGEAGVFLNFELPVNMWIWFLDRWFEGHISPFFDYALIKEEGRAFNLNRGWYGAGLEGFAFLKNARSIYLRVSVGVDVEALVDGASLGGSAPRDGGSIYEIFIGLGHHY
ncbi:MAG TPA: hypothetical protein ENN41_09405 [Sediminispirochaeta sp.]|nr:hypothetical protein [Sediminispirochaeta sp.]